jgi:hypothetical protein
MRKDNVSETSVVSAYREMKNGPKVGLRFGISTNRVYRILEAAGERRTGASSPPSFVPPRKFSEMREKEISRRYAEGERTGLLKKEFGCSSWLIRDIAVRYGARVFGRGNRNREFSKQEIDKMKRLWTEGASQAEVGGHFGISQIVVSRVLRAAGIETSRRRPVGPNHGSWRGGRIKMDGGYVGIQVGPDHELASMRNRMGYVSEHRLVMARKLGHALKRTDVVHYINGVRDDNRPENLELWTGHHPRGSRITALHCPTCSCGLKED